MNIGGVPQNRLPQNRPVKAGGGVDAPQQAQTVAPQLPQQQPGADVQVMSNALSSIFTGIVNFFKSAFNWIANLFKGNSGTSTAGTVPVSPQPPVVTQPQQPVDTTQPQQPVNPAQQPGANWQTIASQYKLQPTEANVHAFLAEVQAYQTDGALGPGSADAGAIKDLQSVLAKWGYQVSATGQYDAATSQAMIAFKQANGLKQTYLAADGNFAVNEYADKATLEFIMKKLEAEMAQQPQAPVVPQPAPQQPAPQPQVNYAAVAAQYKIEASEANVNAFLAEVKAYQTQGTLGPGSADTAAIRDLQDALTRLGFQVPITSQFDAATSQAVMAFKQVNGLHQTYKNQNGNWAINEYAEPQTLQVIMAKLQAQMAQQQPAAQPAPQPAPQPQAPVAQPAPQQPAASQVNHAAVAAQYKIEASEANVNAFLAEVKSYQTDGALGPGSDQKQAITDLQTVLQKWGFAVTPNGSFDDATTKAVMEYKKQNGVHQTYKSADGSWAVNEYADKATLAHIMQKLEAEIKKAS
ncbi:peptidoglycan-binding protein [bacterium]|nr:peptidoglycan-binding protein [bacterium]